MRIAVATDLGGFPIKSAVVEAIQAAGHEVLDLGAFDEHAVDYPDYAEKAGHAIQEGRADRAVLLCGSGVGICIAAGKMKGVYASVCHDTYSARQAVEHDNMNALCLGGRVIGAALAKELVAAFLSAKYSSEERHQRRVSKVKKIEQQGQIE